MTSTAKRPERDPYATPPGVCRCPAAWRSPFSVEEVDDDEAVVSSAVIDAYCGGMITCWTDRGFES